MRYSLHKDNYTVKDFFKYCCMVFPIALFFRLRKIGTRDIVGLLEFVITFFIACTVLSLLILFVRKIISKKK